MSTFELLKILQGAVDKVNAKLHNVVVGPSFQDELYSF